MTEKRIRMIKDKLSSLNPTKIEIEDQSHLHVGHPGSKSGGHFKLTIVSECFKNKSLIERHRIIYHALESLMKTEIHALSINANFPNEKN